MTARPFTPFAAAGRHPADSPHHRAIIAGFLRRNPGIRVTKAVAYSSWGEVPQSPQAGAGTLIFVDGGILDVPLDVGWAVLVNDGGIIRAPLYCGLLHRDGGLTEARVMQRLR